MMKRILLVLLCCMLALSLAGCFGKSKDLSDSEMRKRVQEAMAGLPDDLGPNGRISGASLTLPVEAAGLTVQLPLELAIGPDGAMLLTGSLGNPFNPQSKATVKAYCSADKLIVVTTGLSNFGEKDISVEGRNPAGTCLEVDSDLQDMFGGFAGISDLTRADGRLSLESVTKKEGAIEGLYIDHAEDAEITVLVEGDRVQIINAAADEGDLHVDFHFGERQPVKVPVAAEALPVTVAWSTAKNGDHAQVTIDGNGSKISDYAVRVYTAGSSVSCSSGPTPVVVFDLADGLRQTVDGFRIQVFDDGDGQLDEGDTMILRHPDPTKQDWRYDVEVWDQWADTSAHPFCGIPGPSAPLLGVGLLGLAIAVRRR